MFLLFHTLRHTPSITRFTLVYLHSEYNAREIETCEIVLVNLKYVDPFCALVVIRCNNQHTFCAPVESSYVVKYIFLFPFGVSYKFTGKLLLYNYSVAVLLL